MRVTIALSEAEETRSLSSAQLLTLHKTGRIPRFRIHHLQYRKKLYRLIQNGCSSESENMLRSLSYRLAKLRSSGFGVFCIVRFVEYH